MENENPLEQEPDIVQESEVVQEPEAVQEEPVPAKKNNVLIIIAAAVLGIVLLLGLGLAVIIGTDGFEEVKTKISSLIGKEEETPTEPETTVPEATDPAATEPLNLKSYTVSAEEATSVVNDIAATIGDQKLTNGELQVFYQTSMINFYSQYGMYLMYMGVDFSQPLDQQVFDQNTNQTWQEFILEMALNDWHVFTAMGEKAKAEGFGLDAEGQEYIAGIGDKIQEMAEASGCATAEEFMKSQLGPTATVDGMRGYMERQYFYIAYYDHLKEQLAPTMEQIEQYFAENEEALSASGVTKESGDVVDVRHVLITPETSGTDENGKAVSTEEDWENCRQKAQALLDGWRGGEATEETFHKLAQENSKDGNASTGGLYTGVTEGYMVAEFNDWIFDESRQYGDSDLVKTQFGYHIMYFVKREANWIAKSREGYFSIAVNEAISNVKEQYPIEVNYDAIALS